MMYANTKDGRVEATPAARGTCPACKTSVLAKCGEIKIWHWAHETVCPFEHEPETKWHRKYKNFFPENCREITVENHRADVIHNGTVFQFQKSPISYEDAIERTRFWTSKGHNIRWIFQMSEIEDNFNFRSYNKNEPESPQSFRWKWPRKSLMGLEPTANVTIYFDFAGVPFNVRKIHWDGRFVGGWGKWEGSHIALGLSRDHILSCWETNPSLFDDEYDHA